MLPRTTQGLLAEQSTRPLYPAFQNIPCIYRAQTTRRQNKIPPSSPQKNAKWCPKEDVAGSSNSPAKTRTKVFIIRSQIVPTCGAVGRQKRQQWGNRSGERLIYSKKRARNRKCGLRSAFPRAPRVGTPPSHHCHSADGAPVPICSSHPGPSP